MQNTLTEKSCTKARVIFGGGRSLGTEILRWLCTLDWIEIIAVCLIPAELDADAADEIRKVVKDHSLSEYSLESVRKMEADIGLSVNYHKVIPEDILKICRKGFYNVHHSYNLSLRGRNITTHAILNSRKEKIYYHGTTLHKMVPKLDAGPVIASVSCEIEYTDTAYSLFKKADILALQMVKTWFPRIACQNIFPYQPPVDGVHYYRSKDLPDRKISIESLSAEEIYDHIRAFDFPGKEPAYAVVNGRKRSFVLEKRDNYTREVEIKGHFYYTDEDQISQDQDQRKEV